MYFNKDSIHTKLVGYFILEQECYHGVVLHYEAFDSPVIRTNTKASNELNRMTLLHYKYN